MTLETNNSGVTCYIGLGSNLDNPLSHVQNAIHELKNLSDCKFVEASSIYQSAPIGPPGQDDYINAVVCLTTTLSSEQLLDQLQHVENTHKRIRIERWGARTLDLDILLFGDSIIETARLTIPHAFMTDRNFVLVPLAELNSSLSIKGKAITYLLQHCPPGILHKLDLI
ncbi:MAG: 2-amino-4-hydroxy-6-hydroxymethyldihydropteridine diphosphokinase [Oceanospirillaceae bacterium]|jgi:2-amino-4-hydroxy-6-hydroxymethyldihydropteridine diphosphokinase